MKMVRIVDDSFRNHAMANWLGPVATWNPRRRLIQLLRRAHQSLGIDRKRLGIGGVTLGAIMGSTAFATLSRELGINPKTVAKWWKRVTVEDMKTGPKALIQQR